MQNERRPGGSSTTRSLQEAAAKQPVSGRERGNVAGLAALAVAQGAKGGQVYFKGRGSRNGEQHNHSEFPFPAHSQSVSPGARERDRLLLVVI